ncbi:MAG: hypothetical protein LBE32_00515 [Burkholderiales bacterium]|jgi:hypothetical protein|nr:hypothetical protein [Burkholderiales bacterium]
MSKSAQIELVLAKIEAVYGEDPIPTAALDAIRAANVELTPYEAETVPLAYKKQTFGNNPAVVVAEQVRVAFDIYFIGSGTPGVAPAWGTLLRGCGWAETVTLGTSVLYNPISQNIESVTLYVFKDGILHKITGARGNVNWNFTAKQVPTLHFEFTGTFSPVIDSTMPVAPDFTKWIKPRAAIPTYTGDISIFGLDAMKVRNYSCDTQTEVASPEWVNHKEIVIADRLPTTQMELEAPSMATLNLYDLIQKQEHGKVTYTHGNEPGNTITITHPDAIMTAASYGDNSKILTNQLSIVPLITNGNDDITIEVE